jgi:hypothetical protein
MDEFFVRERAMRSGLNNENLTRSSTDAHPTRRARDLLSRWAVARLPLASMLNLGRHAVGRVHATRSALGFRREPVVVE